MPVIRPDGLSEKRAADTLKESLQKDGRIGVPYVSSLNPFGKKTPRAPPKPGYSKGLEYEDFVNILPDREPNYKNSISNLDDDLSRYGINLERLTPYEMRRMGDPDGMQKGMNIYVNDEIDGIEFLRVASHEALGAYLEKMGYRHMDDKVHRTIKSFEDVMATEYMMGRNDVLERAAQRAIRNINSGSIVKSLTDELAMAA